MNTQREKILLTRMSRLFVFLLGCVSVFTDGLLADAVSILTLACWLYLPMLVKVEQYVLHIITKGAL